MVEIRKSDVFAQWLDGLRDVRARAREQPELSAWRRAMLAMSNRLAKAFQNCGLIVDRDTECISRSEGVNC